MLYYCAYTWQPHTTYEKMAQRFLDCEQAGLHRPDCWRGLYSLAGGGAGFLLVEVDDPRELTEMLQRYKDLVSWDVRAIYELEHPTVVEHMRQVSQRAG